MVQTKGLRVGGKMSKGKLEVRKCALGECGIEFTPSVYWQICCTKEHARRLRYLRRMTRIREALEVAEASEGGMAGSGIPNGDKG